MREVELSNPSQASNARLWLHLLMGGDRLAPGLIGRGKSGKAAVQDGNVGVTTGWTARRLNESEDADLVLIPDDTEALLSTDAGLPVQEQALNPGQRAQVQGWYDSSYPI